MANLTLDTDLLLGTGGDDLFGSVPEESEGLHNTLQTGDAILGGNGQDTLFASLVGSANYDAPDSNVIAPILSDVENVAITFDPYDGLGEDITLDFGSSTGVDHVGIFSAYNPYYYESDDSLSLSNVGDISQFSFVGTEGYMDVYGSTAQNVTVDGSGTLDLSFWHQGDNLASFDSTAFAGDMNFYTEGDLNAGASISTGAGEDHVNVSGNSIDIGNNFSVSTGAGEDYVNINGYNEVTIGDNATIDTGSSEDNNYNYNYNYVNINSYYGLDIGDNLNILGGAGEDGTSINNNYSDLNIGANLNVDTDAGYDYLNIYSNYGDINIGAGANIVTGDDGDYVSLAAYYGDLNIGDNLNIDTGAGYDGLNLSAYNGEDDAVINIGTNASIDTGINGDDVYIYGNLEGSGLISTGYGEDYVDIEGDHTISSDITIDGGAGIDGIEFDAAAFNTLSAGAGVDNIINFEELVIDDDNYDRIGDVFDVSKIGGVDQVTFDDRLGEDTTLSGLESGATVRFEEGGSGDVSIELDNADELNLETYHHQSDATFNIETTGVDTINYEMDHAHGATTVNLTTDATTLNVTNSDGDDESIDFTGVQLSSILEFNATTADGADIAADLSGAIHTREVTTSFGNDDITTGFGVDTVNTGAGADMVSTGNGADVIDTSYGADTVDSGNGADTITTGSGADTITSGNQADTINSGIHADTIDSGYGADTIDSGYGADTIDAGAGADTIDAGAGADTVTGGTGADTIDLGDDASTDTLVYAAQGDSTVSAADQVSNFESGEDKIDLSAIVTGTFDYLEEAAGYSASVALLTSGGNTEAVLNSNTGALLVDVDGDGAFDMNIHLDGIADLSDADFLVA